MEAFDMYKYNFNEFSVDFSLFHSTHENRCEEVFNSTNLVPRQVDAFCGLWKQILSIYSSNFENLPTIIKPSLVPRVPRDHGFCNPDDKNVTRKPAIHQTLSGNMYNKTKY